jgi:hypothetical protein
MNISTIGSVAAICQSRIATMARCSLGSLMVSLCVMTCPEHALAQPTVAGGPLTGPPVIGAPFSAEATTMVHQLGADGNTNEWSGVARYYRDHAGRVRVEQVRSNQASQLDPKDWRTVIQPSVERSAAYVLDAVSQTAGFAPRDIIGMAIGGGDTFAIPLDGPGWRALVFSRGKSLLGQGGAISERALGAREIGGVATIGRSITITIPKGAVGNDEAFEVTEERWESPELKLLIYARSTDPRTGRLEYRLTNIRRSEPPAGLFLIPAGFTVVMPSTDGDTTLEYAERTMPAVGGSRR